MSSWANGNVFHCHVADFSLISSHSVPKQAGNYSAGDIQCLLENVSIALKQFSLVGVIKFYQVIIMLFLML